MQNVSISMGSPVWRCSPQNIGPSGCIISFLPHFHLFFFSGKMGYDPFRWAVNYCVVPTVICWANNCVPPRLGGATQHAKRVNIHGVTNLEM